MKKSLRKAVVATVAIAISTSAYGASQIARFDNTATKFLVPTQKEWKTMPAMQRPVETPKMMAQSVTLGPCQDYSFVDGPNGEEWIALQEKTESTTQKGYFTKSEVQLYNTAGEKTGEFTVEIPEGMNVNQINIGSTVTNRFFDTKSSSEEIPVTIHIIHSPGVASFVTYFYDIATGEKKELSYEGYVELVPYSTGYSTDYVSIVSRKGTNDNNEELTCYDVYQKATLASNVPVLKHTFEIPSKLAEYQIGNVLNVFDVDNNLYYVVTQYEQEYMDPASYEPPYDMIPTEGNKYTITVYNKNFVEVNSIKLDVPVEDGFVTQYGIGLFGKNEFTNGFWSGDDKINIVVSRATMNISSDSESIGFDVYDTDGTLLTTVADGVSDWFSLSDIPGQSEQMAFLATDGTTMSMVDIPSCEPIISFSDKIGGYAISTNIDRYQSGNSYQYVVGLPEAQYNENDETYNVGYAWINTRGTIDKIDWINVGTGFQNWVPLVMGEVLNPFMFDTDDKRDYMFILSRKEAGATALVDAVCVAKEDGTFIKKFEEDGNGIGDLGMVSILGFQTNTPMLFMPFLNTYTDAITIMMEELPFTMFAGGDGSSESPYQITSAGDLAMIGKAPNAHYVVVNDIDMSGYGEWSGIFGFTGTLYGNNHVISNLYSTDKNNYAGLFSIVDMNYETETGATIKDLVFESPVLELSGDTNEAGVLAANVMGATISNIHVIDATIEGSDTYATVGGLIGNATYNTTITDCYVKNLEVECPYSNNVGGITGSTGTATLITSCAVSGNIIAGTTIGGITGSSGSDCAINDCHVNVTIEGDNTIGGVVGSSSRGVINHCFVEGELTSKMADSWNGSTLGGIAGYLEPTFTETAKIITNNVVALDKIETTDDVTTAFHRIVGYSRYEDDMKYVEDDPTITPEAEAGLENNYVVDTIDIIDETISDDSTTTEGKSIAKENLNQEFYEGLGFKYGQETANPWATNTDSTIYLYFENPEYDGVEEITVGGQKGIKFVGSQFEASEAIAIEAYNVSGVKVGVSNSETLNATNLTSGIYIVVATYADGSKASAKVVVK